MIRSFQVKGLNNCWDYELEFYQDINILTGRNGSGKTTVLKLLWYLISGNLERIVPEIPLEKAELITERFTISVEKKVAQRTVRTVARQGSLNTPREIEVNVDAFEWRLNLAGEETTVTTIEGYPPSDELERLNQKIATLPCESVFFPTFRRIEGGFSMGWGRKAGGTRYDPKLRSQRSTSGVPSALEELSSRLSVQSHHFVSSISTDDISELVTRKYADVSERTNQAYAALSRKIIVEIGKYTHQRDAGIKLELATSVLTSIQSMVEQTSRQQSEQLKPFSVLGELVGKVFTHSGIDVGSHTLGDAGKAIASELLSAGEKQMLGFLAFNTFTTNGVLFIDEPELSLHVDWQRTLFPTLLSQGTTNQFIVATHSPFIYSKYSDREIILNKDKGAANAGDTSNS